MSTNVERSPVMLARTDWAALSVEAQEADPASTLAMYRRALSARRASAALGDGELVWLESGQPDVLAMERPGDAPVLVLLNTGDGDRVVDFAGEILVETGGVHRDDEGSLVLPPDSCAWVART